MKYILFIILFYACASWGNIKIAFVSDVSLQQANSAILNGIKNSAKELSSSRGKNIEVLFVECSNSKKQADELSNFYMNGCSAAILMPVDNDTTLLTKISELKKSNFAIVVLGNRIGKSDALCNVKTNHDVFLALLENVINKRSSGNTKIACYFKGDTTQSISLSDESAIKKELQNTMSFAQFSSLFKNRILSIDVVDFYSTFAEKNRIDIMRRDSYGEVFFSPKILANMQPITPDVDRTFLLSIGALPMLEFYFATGVLSDCIYDDFYGWGIYAMRSLIDYKNNIDVKTTQQLRPIYVSKENYKMFVSDWQKWLR